jgi:hypothetical protein
MAYENDKYAHVWVPLRIGQIVRLAAAKLGVTQMQLWSLLILERDNEAWQAIYWAKGEVE